ncbi:MAG: hypothetical protein ACREC5_08865, partial [Thermoplasmata archaeon]
PQPGVAPAPTAPSPSPTFPTVSLQASAAGVLGAGFTTIALKNRPLARRIAALSGVRGPPPAKFQRKGPSPRVGRYD